MVERVGDWALARRILHGGAHRVGKALHQATLQEAHFLRAKIAEGITSQSPGGQAFKPLAPSTLATRLFRRFKGTKALLVKADLRNSLTVVSPHEGVAFVGVLRTARGSRGQALANVAELNEFGSRPIVIRVTPKMLRVLAAVLGARGAGFHGPTREGHKGIIVTQIPARPFIRPVVEKHYSDAGAVSSRFLWRVARLLGGDFGTPGVGL